MLCKNCHKKKMKPNLFTFLPFVCVAAGKLFTAVCSHFEHYFWYKLVPVAMVAIILVHRDPKKSGIVERLLQMKKPDNIPLLHNIVYSC